MEKTTVTKKQDEKAPEPKPEEAADPKETPDVDLRKFRGLKKPWRTPTVRTTDGNDEGGKK
jgi:hypothetical protein